MKSILQKYPIETFACFLAVLQILVLGAYYFTLIDGYDFTGHMVGRDFVNVYLGGELIAQDRIEILFQPDQYWAELRNWLGAQYPIHNWSYPPTMFWVAEPLARFPYYAAYLIWTFFGMIFLGLSLRFLGLNWLWSALVVFSPAGIWNILAGQNAYFIAGLLVFALSASYRHKNIRAGLFWALATVKPHLGLLALPLLAGRKRFGVIGAGAVLFLSYFGLVYFVYGQEPWAQFFAVTVAQQRVVLENWTGLLLVTIPTGFMQGRLLGLPISFAYGLHGIVALATLWMLVRAWPRPKADLRHWLTWFGLGTYLLLPYSFVYDFIVFQVVLALWSRNPTCLFRVENEEIARGIWFFMWMLPLLSVIAALLANVQIMPLALLWLLWQLGTQLPDKFQTDGAA